MRIKTLNILLVILTMCFLGQLFYRINTSNMNKIRAAYDSLKISKDQVDKIIKDQFLINGKTIDNWELLDNYGNMVKISDLILFKNCIFFLFSEFSCDDCIKKNIENIYSNSNGKYDIIILCGFNNFLEGINWMKESNLDCNTYIFKDYINCIFSKNANYPYLFKVSSNLEILSNYSIKDNYTFLNDFFED